MGTIKNAERFKDGSKNYRIEIFNPAKGGTENIDIFMA